jgi:predicted metal-binding membrane protein
MTLLAPSAAVQRFDRYRRWAPEWWLIVPIVAAWLAVTAHALASAAAAISSPAAGVLGPGRALLLACLVPAARGGGGPDLAEAAVMSSAMMLPLALPAARHVALNSLRRRQQRATILFVVAFLMPMVVAGTATAAIAVIVDAANADRGTVLAATLVLAGIYQLSSPKRRALAECRRLVPLPPDGRSADAAVVRFGFVSAWRCLRAGWALMLLSVAVVGAGWLLVAVAVTGLLLAEDPGRAGRRILRPSGALLVAAAATVGVVSV